MCGLAGRFHPLSLPPDLQWCLRADALLAHRGPDGQGQYHDEHCELVHRRLALIDLSPTGLQPMSNEDGSVYVVFNGEIYNHLALRGELQRRGHRFRGTSDTEVLVHLYEQEGEGLAGRLEGMFALAIYDKAHRRIVLARDRFGIKPLYYAVHQGQWVFASEIKAVLALSGFQPELDRQACYDFLGLGYIPEPATGFTNIHAVTKGTTLTVEARRPREATFAAVCAAPDAGHSGPHIVEAVAERLVGAVKRQVVADVPVATLLSGGIDSSLVVASYAHSVGGALTTFNMSFPDAEDDETAGALATSRRYGTDHCTIALEHHATAPDSIFTLLRHFDQPFADASLVPTYWIAHALRQHGIICALTGDGGDEAFGGYAEFWRTNRLIQLMGFPSWALGATRAVADQLAEWTRDSGRRLSKGVQLADAGRTRPALLLAGLANYVTEAEKQLLVTPAARGDLQSVYRHFRVGGEAAPDLEELSRRLTDSLFALSLPARMLRKVDMMGMCAGIELRLPMLDEGLVALALTLPHRLKTDGRKGKLVLRALAARWLPRSVARRPKHGFTIPLDVMVREDFHGALQDLLKAPGSRTAAFLAGRLVDNWLHRFKRAMRGDSGGRLSREGIYQRVLTILALELWMRDHKLTW